MEHHIGAHTDMDDNTFKEDEMWAAYQSVNEQFADAVRDTYEEGDLIWIHGHALFLVPYLLRATLPDAAIGFFLHLPFPSSEIFRILPYRMDILRGLLSCDLVGLNTYDHARHFLSACTRLLGIDGSPREVTVNGHVTNLSICPVGTDVERIRTVLQSTEVRQRRATLRQHFEGRLVLLGMDRLDGTNGITHKLLAFEELLLTKPQWRHKVVLVQVAEPYSQGLVPGNVVKQQQLQAQINTTIARINSKFARVGEEGPIYYFSRCLSYDDLFAMYSMASVLVCTPTRDSMNLTPFEYIVAKHLTNQYATVVLSEFAGCATSLGGAILVNPWDTEAVTAALHQALTLEQTTKRQKHLHMYHCVSTFTLGRWIQSFVTQLSSAADTAAAPSYLQRLEPRLLQGAYERTTCRLLVFDHEGVLAQHQSVAQLAILTPQAASAFRAVALAPENVVVVISPRTIDALEGWLKLSLGDGESSDPLAGFRLLLAAENGYHLKWAGGEWECMFPDADVESWRKDVIPLMEYYAERTPGSFVDYRDSNVAWHYLDADPEHGAIQAAELQSALGAMVKTHPVVVHRNVGSKTIEVRTVAVSKVAVLEYIFSHFAQNSPGTSAMADTDTRRDTWDSVWSRTESRTESNTESHAGSFARSRSSDVFSPSAGDEHPTANAADEATAIADTSQVGEAGIGEAGLTPTHPTRSAATSLETKEEETESFGTQAPELTSASDSDARGAPRTNEPATPFDFILCVLDGDDRTDEAVFERLAPQPGVADTSTVTSPTTARQDSGESGGGAATPGTPALPAQTSQPAPEESTRSELPLDVFACTVGAKVTQGEYYVDSTEEVWGLLTMCGDHKQEAPHW